MLNCHRLHPGHPWLYAAEAVLLVLATWASAPVMGGTVTQPLKARPTATLLRATPPKSAAPGTPAPASTTRHILWRELVPPGWDPVQEVKDKLKAQNISVLSDADPRVIEMMRHMKDVWDTAPTNPEMDGISGRLPGYAVPLEESKQGVREFLLVPYYGACIHSPPPPANQIVHVYSAKPVKNLHTMDTIWVIGTLQVKHENSDMGASGYTMRATGIETYIPPALQQQGQ